MAVPAAAPGLLPISTDTSASSTAYALMTIPVVSTVEWSSCNVATAFSGTQILLGMVFTERVNLTAMSELSLPQAANVAYHVYTIIMPLPWNA